MFEPLTLPRSGLELRNRLVMAPMPTFAAEADAPEQGASPAERAFSGLRCVFIRAPRLAEIAPEIEVLVRVEGAPVLVRRDNVILCTFHPELGDDPRVHRLLDPA